MVFSVLSSSKIDSWKNKKSQGKSLSLSLSLCCPCLELRNENSYTSLYTLFFFNLLLRVSKSICLKFWWWLLHQGLLASSVKNQAPTLTTSKTVGACEAASSLSSVTVARMILFHLIVDWYLVKSHAHLNLHYFYFNFVGNEIKTGFDGLLLCDFGVLSLCCLDCWTMSICGSVFVIR